MQIATPPNGRYVSCMRTHAERVAQLSALRSKYRTLVQLRRESAGLERRGVFSLTGAAGKARRARCRRLAFRFPGALRELDLAPAVLAARLKEVEAELREARAGPKRNRPRRLWISAMIRFHASMREALAVKRWLARRRDRMDLPALRRWYARTPTRLRPVAAVDAAFVARCAWPADRRLSSLVLAEVAAELAVNAVQLRELLWEPQG
ncbi:MAG: hypothetical protein HYZ27_08915 [Deltaproteobacteria bacterium]|nr:hypothetical protein [Deltaproteobacteria bacterium]